MKKVIYLICMCLGFIEGIHAQNEALKPIKEAPIYARGNQYMLAATETLDGCILAVGKNEATQGTKADAWLVKIDKTGKQVYRKSFGTNDMDDWGSAVAELPSGLIAVGGVSQATAVGKVQGGMKAWLKCRDAQGGKVWDKELTENPIYCSVEDIVVDNQRNQLILVTIRGTELWLTISDFSGTTLLDRRMSEPALDGLPIKSAKIMAHNDACYIYAMAEFGADKNAPVLAKVQMGTGKSIVEPIVFGDYSVHGTGKPALLNEEWLVLPLSLKQNKTRADLGVIKIDTGLVKGRSGFDTFEGPGNDMAIDGTKNGNGQFLLFGATTSHNVGATKHDFCLARIGEDGKFLHEGKKNPPIHFGNSYEETPVRILKKADGSLWLCGNKTRGIDFSANSDFWFCMLEKDTVKTVAPIIEQVPQKPLVVQVDEKRSELILAPGASGFLTLAITNPNQTATEALSVVSEIVGKHLGIKLIPEIMVKEVGGNKTYFSSIPVSIEKDASPGDYTVNTIIKDAKGKELNRLQSKLMVTALQMALVESHQSQEKFKKGQACEIAAIFKNTGNVDAKLMSLLWTVPPGVTIQGAYQQSVEKIAVGQTYQTKITVVPSEQFSGDQMELKAFWSESNGDYTQSSVIKVSLTEADKKEETQVASRMPSAQIQSTPNGLTLFVYWKADENEESTTFEQVYEIKAAATSTKELSIDHFKVVHNGDTLSFSGQKFDEVMLTPPQKDGQVFTTNFSKKLMMAPGRNLIEVLVVNELGAAKTQKPFVVNYKPQDKGVLYVVSVGIPDNTKQIQYSQKDALDFAKLMETQKGKFYGDVELTLMTVSDSTEAKDITSKVRSLVNENERKTFGDRDAVVLFLSGHGYIDEDDGVFRIQGSDYDINAKEQTSVNFDKVIQDMEKLSCQKFILVDACQNTAATLAYSGKKGDDSGAFDYSAALEKVLAGSKKVRSINSCSKGEYSFEDTKWENGAFTYILKETLNNKSLCKALDQDNDRGLSLSELFPYMQKEVLKTVKDVKKGKTQTPSMPNFDPKDKDVPFFFY